MSKGKGVSFQSRKESKDRLEEHAVKEVYQKEGDENVVEDMLESITREGARRMLAAEARVAELEAELRRLRGE